MANAIKKRKIASSFLLAMTTVFTAPFRGKTIPRPLGVDFYLGVTSVPLGLQLNIRQNKQLKIASFLAMTAVFCGPRPRRRATA